MALLHAMINVRRIHPEYTHLAEYEGNATV